ncbi:MAG: hypothetical protein KF901_33765, partial [Myxococcales bacterium]|nr:hypothetical protein [Myxococcales bacterium]
MSATRPTLLAAAAWLVGLACTSGTSGREVAFVATFAGDPSFATARTSLGWDLTLERARLVVGPLFAFAPEDDVLTRTLRAPWRPARAYAHPGHEHRVDGRVVRGEVLAQVEVDALDATPQRVEAWGTAGPVDGARLGLVPTTDLLFGRQ